MIEQWRRHGARIALYGGLTALAIGFARHAMWRVLPWERLALSLLLALFSLALAWPLRRFARWSWASSLAVVWSLALVWFTGVPASLAALALAGAGLAIGLAWLPATFPVRPAVAIMTGLALLAGVAGWTVTWPVHYGWSWWALVLALLLWRWRDLHGTIAAARRRWQANVAESPRWAAFAIVLVGLVSTACWLPTMQADDLTYHLGLPSQWLMFAEYRPDPAHQVWALAPWAGDTVQAIAAVMVGEHARGAVNAVWLMLAAASIWSASTSLGARADERWACVALFASLPPLVWMAAGMQTELPATAVLAALAAVIVSPGRGRLYPGAILFGALIGLKGVHVLSALPLLAYAGWRYRHALPWRRLPLALMMLTLVAASSYWLSWRQTGNPVLPLFNGFFESPYYPVHDYRDPRWHAGFDAGLLWRIVFDTDRFVEAWDGGIGFSLVALSGMWLLALLRAPSRGLALALTVGLLLPLLPMQYARYIYPSLALMVIVLLPHGQQRIGRHHFGWLVIGACVLNLAFQANAGWTHHSAALKRVIRSGGEASAVFPHYVPERMLLRMIPPDDHGLVLASNPARGYVAELGGRGRVVFEHDPSLATARRVAEADPSGAGWARLLAGHDIRWVLVTPAAASAALQQALARNGMRVAGVGAAELWWVGDGTMGGRHPDEHPDGQPEQAP